jgi:hypothetical protein
MQMSLPPCLTIIAIYIYTKCFLNVQFINVINKISGYHTKELSSTNISHVVRYERANSRLFQCIVSIL